jgi:hypothetical protein
MKPSIFLGVLGAVLAAGFPSLAASPIEVVVHHAQQVKLANLDAVMSDYADDAVMASPAGMASKTGAFVGKRHIREFFVWLMSPAIFPAPKSMVYTNEQLAPDVVLFHWTQFKGTPKQVEGADLFVIRNGKIVFQAVMPKP